jgi:hypothetical protein
MLGKAMVNLDSTVDKRVRSISADVASETAFGEISPRKPACDR